MMTYLYISNYALIRELELQPGEKFNIITGETGAGKSIMLGALGLLQGKRADIKAVGSPSAKSIVEASFRPAPEIMADVAPILKENDVEADDTLVIRREIHPSGRSSATINGVPVRLGVLSEITDRIVDIHSQHQNLQLNDPAFQLGILDDMAENSALLDAYHKAYAEYRASLLKFSRTRDEIERTGADADYLEYQLNELRKLDLSPDEESELEQLRDTLSSTGEIAEALASASQLLSWRPGNATELVTEALGSLRDASNLSEEYAPLAEELRRVRDSLDSLAETVAAKTRDLRHDPKELAEVERRLERISALKTKHRVSTVGELVELRDSLEGRLAALEDSDTLLKSLEQHARGLKRRAVELASELSERRRAAAESLMAMLTEKARPLGMENLRFEIRIESGKLNPDGSDTVEFLFAFNKNQEPAPAGGRASGGEISRVMLALKAVTAHRRGLPTIIFDEIDTGVSGDVANRMASLMADISRSSQVLTITHLPQVAARGNTHFKVYKEDDETSTSTHIRMLSPEERRSEIALMLSGSTKDPSALAAADTLLKISD
ncbi:MAG: DNA repair protein RecN [Muribaculaceae bacterium]|nr:DNA repair protein RecN [Muribaculaceae bacterium]